jgi:acyl-CoA thioester hydrolase
MTFAYSTRVPVRYRDLDTFEHVNNAVVVTYIEEGRIDYARDVLGTDLADSPVVVASLSVEFERPVTLTAREVTVAVRVPALGESSLPMECELCVGDDVAASAETTLVAVGPEKRPRPLPEAWRESIRAHEPHL